MGAVDSEALYQPEPLFAEDGPMARWAEAELRRIGLSFERALAREIEWLHAAPEKPREGMIRGADGTDWNPGGGAGIYVYYSGAWQQLSSGGGGPWDTADFVDGAVTSAKLGDMSVISTKLGNGAVVTVAIGDLAITAAKLADGSVVTPKLFDAAVTEGKLTDLAVSLQKLGTGAVDVTKLLDGAVTEAKVGNDAITAAKIALLAVGTVHIAASAITTAKLNSGAVTADIIGAAAVITQKLAAGAVTANELGAQAVTTAKLFAGAVTANEIGAGAVTAVKIDTDAITSNKILAGAIVAGKLAVAAIVAGDAVIANLAIVNAQIADGTITSLKIADATITSAKIADANITSAKIADANITTAKIADLTVTGGKIAVATISADKLTVSQLSAIAADLGAVTAGTITLSSSGHIKAGQTAFNTGVGFWLGIDGGVGKLSLGDPSGHHVIWDGSNLSVKGAVEKVAYTAGTVVILANDAEKNCPATGDFTKRKESVLVNSGTITVDFDLRSFSGAANTSARIYVNEVARGTIRTVTGTTYATFSENITISALERIQIYTTSDEGYIRNFRMKSAQTDVNVNTLT